MSPELLSYDEAARMVAAHAARLQPCARIERVPLAQVRGRVLAQGIVADRDQPPFSRSTRDGFACRAAEAACHQPLIVAGASRAGDPPAGPLPSGAAWEIMTGAPVPAGADAVMMLEHVETADDGFTRTVRLHASRNLSAGENVVARAAQAQAGAELLAPGAVLGAGQIALAASCGYAELDVFARPRVAILTTGDELVPVEATPGPGQIRNSNGPMLAALVESGGGEPWLLPVANDTAESLDAAIAAARTADLVLITGGVSAGKFDLVEPALARAGATFHFTGVKIQPGKPTVFGTLPAESLVQNQDSTKCWFGLPGNPVSSAVTFLLFAAPVLAALAGAPSDRSSSLGWLAGLRQHGPRFALARLAAEVRHKPGLTRFLPAVCTFGTAGDLAQSDPVVSLLSWQGSGDLASLARSNCFLVVPENIDRIEAGAIVRILLP